MKPIDFLDHFDKAASAVGFIATYDLNPQFLERRLLAKRAFGSAQRLVIFMDRGRYQELIAAGLNVTGFNRRYLVVPITRAPFVFHPKLYLTLDAKRIDTAVGSNNCTNAGIAYNVETCSTFTVKAEKAESTDVDAKSVIRQVFDAMRDLAADAGALRDTLEGEFLAPAEVLVPWLDRKVVLPKGNVTLVHSHRRPLWTQLRTKFQDLKVRKVTIVSPFFDPNLGLVRKLRSQWPKASMTIVAQEDYATLPGNKVSTLLTQRHDVLFSAEIKPGRRLHAKTFALETNKGTHWIAGSANATSAAFEGGNTEAVLWFATTDEPSVIFEGGPLKLKKIDPKKFRAGKEQEPRNNKPATAGPTLDAAILEKAGRLVCQASGVEGLQQIAVRIRNFNEPAPVLAIPARFDRNGRSSIPLDEDQIAQLRTATLCQLKGVDDTGSDILSNEMALAQLAQLLRERSGAGGPRSALQAIAETGENLVPYVEGLGSVREAVEFFNHCSIRFSDGENDGRGFRNGQWKPRDPFKPDTPPNWSNVPAGGDIDDLREAILNFVERHQREKLNKHMRRGNLNGLPNFLDIFRTLNALLLAYHRKRLGGGSQVVPFGYVIQGIMINLELLIGPFEGGVADWYEGRGFVASIFSNLVGDTEFVREQLQEERVPQMVRAAAEAMVRCRAQALGLTPLDTWSQNRLRWVTDWIRRNELSPPTPDEIRAAGREYGPMPKAA
jgi:hypothetical protein